MNDFEKIVCGWYYFFTDKQGVRQRRGPWFTLEQAQEERRKMVKP
jgi:hypothetical protein